MKLSEIRSLDQAEYMHRLRVADACAIWEKYSQNFKFRPCPICESNRSVEIDRFHNSFRVSRCNLCNTPFVNPAPSYESLNDFYQNGMSNKYLNSLYKERDIKNGGFVIDERAKKISQLIESSFRDYEVINVLEIGCNQGGFLSQLRKMLNAKFPNIEFNFYGTDIDADAIDDSHDAELDLRKGWAEEITSDNPEWEGFFDIVCHFELIEHLIKPSYFMQEINRALKKDGFTVFSTPNYEGAEIQVAGYNEYRLLAHSIIPPLHINAFSTHNISLFSVLNGFDVKEITTPGKLDVDCVEKYINKKEKYEGVYSRIKTMTDEDKAWLQALIAHVKGSSSMMVVLQKNCA